MATAYQRRPGLAASRTGAPSARHVRLLRVEHRLAVSAGRRRPGPARRRLRLPLRPGSRRGLAGERRELAQGEVVRRPAALLLLGAEEALQVGPELPLHARPDA